jgi:UDP-N-acetylglucosamine--N-acetylmuramyl-(pentapeptide) pyrophosphoryl-undecaprenol N-acetylglucosamine transferase
VVIIAGGGTAGHLFPGVAIAQELLDRHPDWPIHFAIAGLPLERRILDAEGIPALAIRSGGLRGKSLPARIRNLGRVALGLGESLAAVRRLRPRLIVGVGGYVSGPVVLAGALLRKPTLLHEQNVIPGLTNRLLEPLVDEIAVSFRGTPPHLGGRGQWTGNPIRKGMLRPAPPPRDDGPLRLLVFGGSQGARRINDVVVDALPQLRELPGGIGIVHATGEADHDRVAAAYRQAGIEVRVTPFLRDMAAAYVESDLVVCRAGATTCAELTAVGRPAILIPLARAAGGHQARNAGEIAAAGGAVVLDETELTAARLAAMVRDLRTRPGKLREMAAASASIGKPDAAARVADIAERLIEWELEGTG